MAGRATEFGPPNSVLHAGHRVRKKSSVRSTDFVAEPPKSVARLVQNTKMHAARGPIKSARARADGVGMDEAAVAFWLLISGLAGWTVLGSLSAIAKRLDDQVCMHNLRIEALALHRSVRRRALGLDGWDVDIIDEPDTAEIIDEDTENTEPLRKAA